VALGQFFDELKRRNVFRVAVAYLVSAWLVLQIADVILNNISAPDWVFSVFMLAGAVCFVPVLVFAWAYELTPEGIKREREVDRDRSITPRTGRKLDQITIGMLVAVVAFVLLERFVFPGTLQEPADTEDQVVSEEVTVTSADDKSIAVLAFDDLSAEGDQAFFAEGLSEEILNVLAQVPGLKVAGRTSSFAFKGRDADLREIGEVLNVAHILEGSVRKAGDRIRVTAQLIQASDGFHLFSKTYDRDLDDIFKVQDELAALISTALKAQLSDEKQLPVSAETSIEAYDLYLLARQRIRSRNPQLMAEATDMLDQALAIDPRYAPALAQRALAVHLLSDEPGAYGDIPAEIARPEAMALLDRALEIDPGLAEAHAVRGLLLTNRPGTLDEAIASLHRALEINPNHESAKLWLGNAVPDLHESTALYEEVAFRDPMFAPAFNNLIQNYLSLGRFDESEALIDRVRRIKGDDPDVHQALGTVEVMRGDISNGIADLDVAFEANPNATVTRMWLSYALLQTGQFERAASDGIYPVTLDAVAELGDFEKADRMLAETDFLLGDSPRKIRHAAKYLASRGRAAEMADIVDRNFGGVEQLLEAFPVYGGYGAGYLGPLAYVYRQLGREAEFRLLIDEMRAVLDRARVWGSDNWINWLGEAQYAALTGDAEAAVDYVRRAADKGFATVVVDEPLFDPLDGDTRFQAVVAAVVTRGNAERADLGLEPYRPIAPTN